MRDAGLEPDTRRVGSVGTYIQAQRMQVIDLTASWHERLASRLEMTDGPEAIRAAIDDWAGQLSEDDEIARWHWRMSAQGAFAGLMMVHGVEAPAAAEDETERSRGIRAGEGGILAMPYEEALELMRSASLLSPEALDDLIDQYRAGGFRAAEFLAESMRTRAADKILKALEGDLTIREVVQQVRDEELSLGIAPTSPTTLDRTVRTSIMSAYGAGKWRAQQDPDVQRLMPWARYLTVSDVRVRPNHAALHNVVVPTGSDLHAQIAPPGGYRCRCAMSTLSDKQRERFGLTVSDSIPADGFPDPGWEGPPVPLA